MSNPLKEIRDRLFQEEIDARTRVTSKYTCAICQKPDINFNEKQKFSYFKDNFGSAYNDLAVEEKMVVCSEKCRVEYVSSGFIPYSFLMRGVDIPKRFEKSRRSMLGPKRSENLEAFFKQLEEGKNRGLYLGGGTGNGKTFFASVLAYELRKRERTVKFTTGGQIAITANAAKDPEKFLKQFLQTEFLIIDDLSVHNLTTTGKELMFELFAQLYNDEKIVIITSNLKREDVSLRIDERLHSRLQEMCDVIPFAGADKRQLNDSK